jgi:phosphoglycolate phosphatase-like HAD superfamily hydrolase
MATSQELGHPGSREVARKRAEWRRAMTEFQGTVLFQPTFAPRPEISHVLFDFDGTISLVRQGWPDVMVPMFTEVLPPLEGETDAARRRLAFEDIMRLNGKQTIYQMIQLADRVRERGGEPREPLWYKHEYLRRLDERIKGRLDGLAAGRVAPDELLVHGARGLLENLKRRGLNLYLASGTDEPFVKREAELLDVARYFGPHIYGAQDDYKSFSKKMVIERILRANAIPGARLLSFGDGYVEIENTKDVGGLAVAVTSDEANNGSGRMDEWKRERLSGVGAAVVVPDYRDAEALLERIFTS